MRFIVQRTAVCECFGDARGVACGGKCGVDSCPSEIAPRKEAYEALHFVPCTLCDGFFCGAHLSGAARQGTKMAPNAKTMTIEGAVRDLACPVQNPAGTAKSFSLQCTLDCVKHGSPIIILTELAELIARRKGARPFIANETVTLSALIFHRNGEPIREFRKSWWATACTKAGIHRLFHDLRRSACRNMVAAGVAQAHGDAGSPVTRQIRCFGATQLLPRQTFGPHSG